MTRLSAAILVCTLYAALIPAASEAQLPPVRERLGGRLGYVGTDGGLRDSYGGGYNATLHFTERAWGPLFVDIRIGAVYMGDLKRPVLAENFTFVPDIESAMRILFISAGPQYAAALAGPWIVYGSIGLGIYSVSVLFDTGVQAADVSQQRLGGNASVGALLHIAGSWNLDLNFSVHHFRTRKRTDELFYIFTDGDSNPFLFQVATGIVIDLR